MTLDFRLYIPVSQHNSHKAQDKKNIGQIKKSQFMNEKKHEICRILKYFITFATVSENVL